MSATYPVYFRCSTTCDVIYDLWLPKEAQENPPKLQLDFFSDDTGVVMRTETLQSGTRTLGGGNFELPAGMYAAMLTLRNEASTSLELVLMYGAAPTDGEHCFTNDHCPEGLSCSSERCE